MILYRYRPLNDHTLDSIFNHYLYFSKPSSFNDPFDCHFTLTIEGNDDEKMDCVKRMVSLLNLSGEERRKAEEDCLQEMLNKELDYDFIYKRIDEINDKVSICCLSDTCDDLLMWAHYAEGHNGICLKYDIERDSFPDCILERVDYLEDLVKVNIVKMPEEPIIPIFTTKSKHWKYENEFRLINHSGIQKVKHQPGSLKGIIFGYKVDNDEKNKLLNAIKAKGWHLYFYQAVQSREKYALSIDTL